VPTHVPPDGCSHLSTVLRSRIQKLGGVTHRANLELDISDRSR